ncbi:MAG: A24 family peptidase [Candidatus Nitrosothermus koennekii]|nr:MAG: A24 family peptidase [Candidatus Nitrosothermus koennekii]
MLEIRIAICLVMLIIASIMDLKKREISDKVWIISGSIGIILLIIDHSNLDLFYAISLGIVSIIAYAIYGTGMFGGADAKALVVISLLLPYYEINNSIHNIPALTVLTNGVILTIVNVFHNIIRNSIDILRGNKIFDGFNEPLSRKILAFILGFKAKKINGYLFLMEDEGKRFRFHVNAYDDFVEDARDVWVTAALPFIIYMTIGFVIMLIYGDIVGSIITLLIR